MKATEKRIIHRIAYQAAHEPESDIAALVANHIEQLPPKARFLNAHYMLHAKEEEIPLIPPAQTIRGLLRMRHFFSDVERTTLTREIMTLMQQHADDRTLTGQASLWALPHFHMLSNEKKTDVLHNTVQAWAAFEYSYRDICHAVASSGKDAENILKSVDAAFNKNDFDIARQDDLHAERGEYQESPEFQRLFPNLAFSY